MDISDSEVASLESVGQLGVIETKLIEHRCLKIVDMDGIANDVVRIVVRLT